jgi:hypothetical protein
MKKLTCAILLVLGTMSSGAAQDQPAQRPVRDAEAAHSSWNWNDGWRRVHVESRGRVELTDDERDVKSVSTDGYFEISSRGWWSLFGQRYIVQGNADGSTTRRFMVGSAERPVDAETHARIGDTIQRLARSGFGAESRVARILAREGPSGVLDAIPMSPSDFVRAKYFLLLFSQARLDPLTAERAIRESAKEIGSDYELARVLMAAADSMTIDEALAPAFLDATNAIHSDYEHARVLLRLLAKQQTRAAVTVVIASSSHIRSDYEEARVLNRVAEQKDLSDTAVLGIVRATDSIGSDYEKARVLLTIVAAHPIEKTTQQAILETAAHIGSDHQRGRVLSAMLRGGALTTP